MPSLAMLFGDRRATTIGVLLVDAALQQTIDLSATPTKNEVESGSDVADHVKLENVKLVIEGIISNAPVSAYSTFTGVVSSGVGGAVGQASPLLGAGATIASGQAITGWMGSLGPLVSSPNVPRNPKDAFLYLVDLWKKREPFSVVTSLTRFDNMVITALSFPRNVASGSALQFTATFEQIRIVTTNVVALPGQRDSTVNTAKKGQRGPVATETPKPTTVDRAESWLLGGIKAAKKAAGVLTAP